MTSPSRLIVSSLAIMSLLGAGCGTKLASQQEVTGPRVSTFEGLTPKEATAKINFIPGSVIEMRQTFLGFGAQIAAKLAGENKEGTRVIVVSRFAPREVGNVEWKLSHKVETDASVKARAAAEKEKKPVPEPEMVDKVSLGGVDGFNLKNAHSLYLPAFWPETTKAPSFGTSGIWLSGDVYDDLSRNRVSTLDFGILNANLQGAVGKVVDIRNAMAKLQTESKGVENRIDIYKIDGEKDLVEWPLKVNGKDIKVEVIKAKSWFGEIVVLNNLQNPLVLKVTLNPLAAGTAELFSGLSVLKALIGYEVTALIDVQE